MNNLIDYFLSGIALTIGCAIGICIVVFIGTVYEKWKYKIRYGKVKWW